MNAADIAKVLGGARREGTGYKCRCPAHEDRHGSLHVSDAPDGKLLWHCHTGCSGVEVHDALKAAGLLNGYRRATGKEPATPIKATSKGERCEPRISAPPPGTDMPSMVDPRLGKPSASWPYRDASGNVLFVIARYDPADGRKQIRPWSWDAEARSWIEKAWPAPRPLYGLDRLATRPQAPVIVVEGEKACDALQTALGDQLVVITWPGGAEGVANRQSGKAHVDLSALRGRDVTIWPDADAPGRAAAETIARLIGGARILDVSDKRAAWDAADAVAERLEPR